jgi:hypothetical protein
MQIHNKIFICEDTGLRKIEMGAFKIVADKKGLTL